MGPEGRESACKPGSVKDSHSSGAHVTVRLERPTRGHARAARCGTRPLAPLFGLAPGGVYPAADVATGAVRSYRTISPLPPGLPGRAGSAGSAVSFLWHFPWARAPQALPGTLPCGARTFLPSRGRAERLSGRLPRPILTQVRDAHGVLPEGLATELNQTGCARRPPARVPGPVDTGGCAWHR